MVLSVCRRMLRCDHDAEDAFQAVFLLLARKAATVRRREATAGWLYQTACRIALRPPNGAEKAGRRSAGRGAHRSRPGNRCDLARPTAGVG